MIVNDITPQTKGVESIHTGILGSEQLFKEKSLDVIEISEYCELSDRIGKGVALNDFMDIIQNLEENKKRLLLKYMVENGNFGPSALLARRYGIDRSYLSYDSFMNGFRLNCSRIGRGLSCEDALDYLFLYRKPCEFYEEITQLGYIEFSYEIKQRYPDLKKFDDIEMSEIIDAYKRRNIHGAIFFGGNHKKILESISVFPKKHLAIFERTIRLKEMLYEFNKSLEVVIRILKDINFNLIIKKIIENPNDGEEELKEILARIQIENIVNTISVVFISSMGIEMEMDILVLQENNIYLLEENDPIIQNYNNRNKFLKEINRLYKMYSDDLNIPFSILLLKKEGKTATPPSSFTRSIEPSDTDYVEYERAA